MKNKLLFIVLAMLFILSASLVGCENEGQTEDKTTGVVDKTPVTTEATIKLNYKNISMYDGEEFTLVSTVEGYEGSVTWESSDTEIVTVDQNGVVKALKEGSAVITAKIPEAMATCTVKVDKTDVFAFTSSDKKIYVGKTTQLNLNHLFKGEVVKDATVKFSSSDDKIVTVDDKGYVTGKKTGEAKITATYGNLTAEININVANLITITLDITEVTLNPNVDSNNRVTVTGSVKKNGINVKNATIVWSVLNDKMIKITSDKNKATLKALGCGNTALIAEYEGEIATCIITSYKTVSTIADMEGIKVDYNGWFKLVNDIDFTGHAWSSITPWMGDPVNPELYFGGIFDGQGYTLSNINCLSGWHQGLFGLINENAIVKNFSIVNLVNQATSNKSGSVVSLNYGRVENVYVETTILGDSQSMWNAHGGLIATNHPTGVVKNCIVKVNATRVFKNTGALCGYNCGIFENCYAICTDAVLPTVFTQTSDLGELINSYTYSDEAMLYGENLYKEYDKNIWNISDYAVASLYSYPNVEFNAVDTYLTVGKEYIINPFNVKGLDAKWTFEGDLDAFDYFIEDDGTLNVLPMTPGELNVSVTLLNGDKATTKIVAKGVVLVPNSEFVSLDYLNPRLDDEFTLSFLDEDNNSISNKGIKFISNNQDIVTVSEDGVIKAVGGGKTTLSIEYQGSVYVDLVKVDVTEWIQISTPEQLDAIRHNTKGMYCLVNDIDFGGNVFSTIGRWDGNESDTIHFSGTFDGNGYTISNLQLPAEGDTSGIWGQTNPTSIIRNTNFINIKSPVKSTDNYGIVGFNTGVIENIYVEMSVSTGGSTDIRSGGGVVGTNEFRGKVSNCISVIRTDGLDSSKYFGALAGLNQGVLENSFAIVYGNEYNQVSLISFDNGTSLASSLYAHRDLKEATSRAIAKETPFGAFSSVMWVIEPNKLPTLKRLK